MAKKNKKEALVIVHLSSLDAYTAMDYERNRETLVSEDKAFWIEWHIMRHKGPVYIVDQGWDFHPTWSEHRKPLMDAIRFRPDIVWIKFDEDTDDWGPFLRSLIRRLKADGVTDVTVGGFWFERSLKGGCATHVYLTLRRHFKTDWKSDVVGCEDDFDPEEDDENGGTGMGPGGLLPIMPLGPV